MAIDLGFLVDTGTLSEENGVQIVTVSPNATLNVSSRVLTSSSALDGFQLSFANSASELALSSWTNNGAAWTAPIDATLNSAAGDRFVSSATFSPVTIPPVTVLGSFQVTAPTTPGDYRLTVNHTGGSGTLFNGGGQAVPVNNFGDLIVRVPQPPAQLSIAATDATKPEANDGTTHFTFTVTRTGDTSGPASATYTVTGSGSAPADATDFGGTFPTGTVSFAATETSMMITVPVSGDTAVEPDEGFTVTLSAPSGAVLGTAAANGAIWNDDVAAGISLDFLPNTGTLSVENGVQVVTVSPSTAMSVTSRILQASSLLDGFQLSFANSASELALSSWANNGAAWTAPIDATLNSAAGDRFVSSATFSPVTIPPITALGTFQVTAPATPGDYRLTVNHTGGSGTLFNGGGQAVAVSDFGDLIVRVPGTAPGITVTTNGAVQISESGSAAQQHETFTVVLNAAPTSNVVITLQSSDAGEADVTPATLTFTPGDYNVPQNVTVSGVNDNLNDGDQPVTITVAVDANLSDDTYDTVASQTVAVTVLDVPVAPRVTGPSGSGQSTTPTFTWDDVADETFYSLYLIDITNSPATVAYTDFAIPGNTTSYTLPTNLTAGHNYRYFIRAHNDNGFSSSAGATGPGFAFGDFAVGSIVSEPPATTAANSATSGSTPTISWPAAERASTYEIYLIDLDAGTVAASTRGLTTTSYTPSSALSDGRYRIFVRAWNAYGTGGFGAPFDFAVGTPLAPPTVTSANGVTTGNPPTISWPASERADTYEVYLINLDTGAAAASVRGLAQTSFTPATPLPDARYRVFVRAWNSAGTSGFGSHFDFSVGAPLTAPEVPTELAATNTDTARPTLTWGEVASATSYSIWFVNVDSGALVASVTNLATNSYTHSEDLASGKYGFYVKAHNAAGSSRFSARYDFVLTPTPAIALPDSARSQVASQFQPEPSSVDQVVKTASSTWTSSQVDIDGISGRSTPSSVGGINAGPSATTVDAALLLLTDDVVDGL